MGAQVESGLELIFLIKSLDLEQRLIQEVDWSCSKALFSFHPKNFHASHRIFGTLNIDKRNKPITQFG